MKSDKWMAGIFVFYVFITRALVYTYPYLKAIMDKALDVSIVWKVCHGQHEQWEEQPGGGGVHREELQEEADTVWGGKLLLKKENLLLLLPWLPADRSDRYLCSFVLNLNAFLCSCCVVPGLYLHQAGLVSRFWEMGQNADIWWQL